MTLRAPLAALAWLLAAPVGAQMPYMPLFTAPGERVVSLNLGLAQPTGTSGLSSVAGRGPSLGLEYFKYLSDWFALGAALDLHQLGSGADAGPPARSGTASFKGLSFLGRVNFMRNLEWTPYAVGGGGVGMGDVSVQCTGPGCGPVASHAKSALGACVTFGAGVERFLTQGLSLAAEARVTEFHLPLSSASFPAPAGTGQALAFRLGLRLWLGAPKD